MASYSRMKSKRQRGTVSEYVPAYDQTPPIYPATKAGVKGWSISMSKEAELYEKKDFTRSLWWQSSWNGVEGNADTPSGTPDAGWVVGPGIGSPTLDKNKWGIFYPFMNFEQGTGDSQRVGRQIQVCSYEFKMTVNPNYDRSYGGCLMWKIMLDKQWNGTGPSWNATNGNCPWTRVATMPTITDAPKTFDPTNLAAQDRYEVLKEGTAEFQPVGGLSGGFIKVDRCITIEKKVNLMIPILTALLILNLLLDHQFLLFFHLNIRLLLSLLGLILLFLMKLFCFTLAAGILEPSINLLLLFVIFVLREELANVSFVLLAIFACVISVHLNLLLNQKDSILPAMLLVVLLCALSVCLLMLLFVPSPNLRFTRILNLLLFFVMSMFFRNVDLLLFLLVKYANFS